MWEVDSMSLKVITTCPYCNRTEEAWGVYLSSFDLKTTEGWVIECCWCNHVFLHNVSEKDKEPQLEMTKYHKDVEDV